MTVPFFLAMPEPGQPEVACQSCEEDLHEQQSTFLLQLGMQRGTGAALGHHKAVPDASPVKSGSNTTMVPLPATMPYLPRYLAGTMAIIAFSTYALGLLTMCPDEPPAEGTLKDGQYGTGEDIDLRRNDPLTEDIYHLAVSSLVRDAVFIVNGSGKLGLRISRLLVHLFLVMATICVQIMLVVQIKMLVTPQAVNSIRESYDQYEFIMYGSQETHTTLTVNGKHRGKPEYFQPELFETLDDDLKKDVCNIPFSQRTFFMLVLFIWSLTCIGQIRQCLELVGTIVWVTPTISSMGSALIIENEDKEGDADHDGIQERLIAGLTPLMKTMLMTLVLTPWLGLTLFLLWLGCRWFAATNDLGELVANAVALEFILLLKELLYFTLVSERSKRELRNTYVYPAVKEEVAGYRVFLSGVLWGIITLVWVFLYVYRLQAVLPEYRWDVHDTCTHWFANLLARPA